MSADQPMSPYLAAWLRGRYIVGSLDLGWVIVYEDNCGGLYSEEPKR